MQRRFLLAEPISIFIPALTQLGYVVMRSDETQYCVQHSNDWNMDHALK